MGVYQFTRTQKLNSSINAVWDFIATPSNLNLITPDELGFDIKSDLPSKMYEGLMIIYKVTPLLGIKTTWVTEITHIKDEEFFIDEQRVGPYALWHHEHQIEKTEEGVLMTDIITYQPPFGFLGAIMNRLVIKKKLNEIFSYREKVLEEMFNKR